MRKGDPETGTAEHVDLRLDGLLVGVDFFDYAGEALERSVNDLDPVSDLDVELDDGLLDTESADLLI